MTDTEPLSIPFHLRERSMEVALLSCWLYCVDTGFACLWLCWPVLLAWSSVCFLLCLLCLPVLLAGQSGCFLPPVYFFLSARASGRAVVVCVVLCVCRRRRRRLLPVCLVLHVLLMHLSTLSLHGFRKLLRSAYVIRFVCVCVCLVSGPVALALLPFRLVFPFLLALSEFGLGGVSSTSYCLVLSLPCCCVRLLFFLRLSVCNYLMSIPDPGRFRLSG